MEPNVTQEGIKPAEILLSVRSLENDTKNLKLADDITITETPIFNDITLKIDNLEDEIFEEKSANENGEKNEQDLKIVDLESDTICSIVPTADFFFLRTDSYHPVLDPAPYFGPPPVYETPTEEIKNTFFQ